MNKKLLLSLILFFSLFSILAHAETWSYTNRGFDIDIMRSDLGRTALIVREKRFFNGTDYEPVNTTIVSSDNPLYNYMVKKTFYEAYFKADPSTAETIKYWYNSSKKNSTPYKTGYVTLQPMTLNFRNDLDQIQQISTVQATTGYPSDNKLIYPNIFPNSTLTYIVTHSILNKELKIENLPQPEQYIIDGGNVTVDIDFVFVFSDSTDLVINGTAWDKSTTKQTSARVEFRDSSTNELLFYMPEPYAYDNKGNRRLLKYQFKKSGAKYYVIVKTPYSFINNSYPVTIDPDLVVDGTTTEVCGSQTYAKVDVMNGGTAQICLLNSSADTGFWNVTATAYFNITSGSTLSGDYRGNQGGNATHGTGFGDGAGGAGNNAPGYGAGGGGYGGSGGCGTNYDGGCSCYGAGGTSYGTSGNKTIEIGSGGGAGSNNAAQPTDGGNGSASAYINSPLIKIQGTANLRGGNGGAYTNHPGGGGGSGGLLILDGDVINISSSTINLNGGIGGNGVPSSSYDPGGGGGGGRFRVFYLYFYNASTTLNVNGGSGGTGRCTAPSGSSGTAYYEQANFAPTWSSNTSSYPSNYLSTQYSTFNVTWSDDLDSNAYNFSYIEMNYSGNAKNYTTTRAGNRSEYQAILPSGTFYFKFYANDSSNFWNTTDTWTFTISKGRPSLYDNWNLNASTIDIETPILTYAKWWILDSGINLSYYILETNNSGSLVNSTYAFAETNSSWSNQTITINKSRENQTVSFKYYANHTGDSTNYTVWNSTSVLTVSVNSENPSISSVTYEPPCVQKDTTNMIWTWTQNDNNNIAKSYCNYTSPADLKYQINSSNTGNTGSATCEKAFNETGTWYVKIYVEDPAGNSAQTSLYAFDVQASCGSGEPSGGGGGGGAVVEVPVEVPVEPCMEGWYFDTATQKCLPKTPISVPLERKLVEPIKPDAPYPLNLVAPFHIMLSLFVLIPTFAKGKIARWK